MMIREWLPPALALIAWISASAASAQPAELILHGHVFHLGADGAPVPEKGLQVTHDGFNRATVTNDDGDFRLAIPGYFVPGEEIRLSVAKEGWRMPLGGLVRIPSEPAKDRIRIEMLPLGSDVFLSPESIETFIVDTLRTSVQRVRLDVEEPGFDFSRSIREWAERYGLSPESAKTAIEGWIAEVKEASDDERRLGLAAFAERQFAKAASHFGFAAAASRQDLARIEKAEEALAVRRRNLRRDALADFRESGLAFQRAQRFGAAAISFRSALKYVEQHEDPEAWAALQLSLENAFEAADAFSPLGHLELGEPFQLPLPSVLAPTPARACRASP
jgi:hypothetical protein